MGASAGLMQPLREPGMDFSSDDSAEWNGGDRFLTREVLAGIQKKSGPEIPRKRSFSRNTRFTVEKTKELSQQTQDFLKRIGIEDTSNGDIRTASTNNQQKTKLVAHVFDCLNALEQMVALDQDKDEMIMEETQSVCDSNTKSVGKLVHELVSICGLCGESLKVLLDSQPAAATVEDTAGRLPLHVAVDKNKPWLRLIATLVAAYPDGCKSRDGGGRLPIHIAVDRNNPSIEVVRLLISTYPDGAVMRRGVGRLPIHYAVFYDHPNLEVVNFLLETYPTGAKLVDVYGRLPLHYAVDRARPNLDVVKTLLHVFPDGVFAKDTLSRSPLSIAVDHGEPMPVEVLRILVAAYPISVKEKGPMGKLPLLIAVETARPSLACVRFLAQSYPDAISCGAIDGKEDTPLSTCRARGLEYLERELLLHRPELDRARLRELNWLARRLAVIISTPRSQLKSTFSPPKSSLMTAMSTEMDLSRSESAYRRPEIIMSVDASDDRTSPYYQRESRGGTSPGHLNLYTEWDFEHKTFIDIQRFYSKLYTRNQDLWRLMIHFL